MSQTKIIYWILAAFCMLTLMAQQSKAIVLLDENFSTDVIGSGNWTATDSSVSVDTLNGWLHIASSGWFDWDDAANKSVNLTLPIVFEVRMRLVSGGDAGGGGVGYTLPGINLFCSSPFSDTIGITYLVGDNYGWQLHEFTDVDTMGPQNENEWMTIKAIIRVDGGELLVKSDMDTEFTSILTRNWLISSEIVNLRLVQPWDAVCDFDYVRVTTPDENFDLGFRPNPNGWNFSNTRENAWPYLWNDGDPLDERCCQDNNQRCFPTWELFRDVFGRDQVEELINDQWRRRPSALEKWNTWKKCWGGSCSGFSVTSLLYYDDLRDLNQDFSGHGWNDVYDATVDDDVRHLINTYQFYWYGQTQQNHVRNVRGRTPSQTLQDCISMFQNSPSNDAYLYMANNNGGGAHAIVPYKIEPNQNDPNIRNIYVYDCNKPGDATKRIEVDTSSNTWSYSEWPNWGGSANLFLMDPIADYSTTPIMANEIYAPAPEEGVITDLSQSIRIYQSDCDTFVVKSVSFDSAGIYGGSVFNTIAGAWNISPPTGSETPPVGFELPNDLYNLHMKAILGSTARISIFTDNNIFAVSGIPEDYQEEINISYKGNDSTVIVKNIDSNARQRSFKTIRICPDSEVVLQVEDMFMGSGDSCLFSNDPYGGLTIKNFGASSTYGLLIEIIGQGRDTLFHCENINIDANTSHLIEPRQGAFVADTIDIFVDNGNDGIIDDTLKGVNDYYGTPPCNYVIGDANGNGTFNGIDVSYSVGYFKGGPPPPYSCECNGSEWYVAGDVNGNCAFNGIDVSYMVAYFKGGSAPIPCPDCAPTLAKERTGMPSPEGNK